MEVLGQVRCKSQYHSYGSFTRTKDQENANLFLSLCIVFGMIGSVLFFC